MMKLKYITPATLLLILVCSAFQTDKSKIVQLLIPGKYSYAVTNAKSGEEWFGLYELTDGYFLVKTHITVAKPKQNDSPDAKEISTDQKENARFLVNGLLSLSEGFVKTVYSGVFPLEINKALNFTFNRTNYNIVAKGQQTGEDIQNYELGIYKDQNYQRIVLRPKTILEGLPIVLWVGDLDRDNMPDVLIDMKDKSNISEPTLFLSSAAGKGEIIHRVAYFESGGC